MSCFDQQCFLPMLTGLHGATSIAVHKGHLYWAASDAGELWTAPTTDGGVIVRIASGLESPHLLIPFGDSLVFVTGRAVQQLPLDGGAPSVIGWAVMPITALAVSDAGISLAAGGVLSRLNADGGLKTVEAVGESIVDIYAEGQDLFWGRREVNKTSVFRLSDAGSVLLHVDQSGFARFALTSDSYLWSEGQDFLRVPRDGGVDVDVLGPLPVSQIFVAQDSVAYIEGTSLHILSAGSSSQRTVSAGTDNSGVQRGVAADHARVYWFANGSDYSALLSEPW